MRQHQTRATRRKAFAIFMCTPRKTRNTRDRPSFEIVLPCCYKAFRSALQGCCCYGCRCQHTNTLRDKPTPSKYRCRNVSRMYHRQNTAPGVPTRKYRGTRYKTTYHVFSLCGFLFRFRAVLSSFSAIMTRFCLRTVPLDCHNIEIREQSSGPSNESFYSVRFYTTVWTAPHDIKTKHQNMPRIVPRRAAQHPTILEYNPQRTAPHRTLRGFCKWEKNSPRFV